MKIDLIDAKIKIKIFAKFPYLNYTDQIRLMYQMTTVTKESQKKIILDMTYLRSASKLICQPALSSTDILWFEIQKKSQTTIVHELLSLLPIFFKSSLLGPLYVGLGIAFL